MYWPLTWDIVGSIYEFDNLKSKDFPLFWKTCFYTDDSVLTIATEKALLEKIPYDQVYRDFTLQYPNRGYGSSYIRWAMDPNSDPYNSYGNGSAMRVWPVGWFFDTLEKTLEEAEKSAIVTHNHSEGIKGAQATAAAIFLARKGKTQDEIKIYLESKFSYDLSRKIDEIRKIYQYNETCQKTVPESIIAFLESNSFEDAIRNAISIGWDSDTLACITWSIAEAYYWNISKDTKKKVSNIISDEMRGIMNDFYAKIKLDS